MNLQSIIVINPYCHQGLGWRRWLSVKETVQKLVPGPIREIILERGLSLEERLSHLLHPQEEQLIVSAGGDGSIHFLVNSLINSFSHVLEKITFGAIGLGSSNDFLKPFNQKIDKIPVRIQRDGPVLHHDVGVVKYQNGDQHYHKKYFIVNASFGVTARANWEFNQPGKILQVLKKYSTDSAILYAAIQTIIKYKNTDCRIEYGDVDGVMNISNINILKNPNVSGSFKYPQQIFPDDGRLGLNICHDMSKKELLMTLLQLGKGKFLPDEKKISTYTASLQLCSASPIIFECDGETEKANYITISILPKAIKILTS